MDTTITIAIVEDHPFITQFLREVLSDEGYTVRAGQDALSIGSAAGMADEATIRTHLTARGLTPRQCDLVVLDVQGHSRADIAELCGVSPATVKKYWAAIYARLGVENRQMLRAWVLAQLGGTPAPQWREQLARIGK